MRTATLTRTETSDQGTFGTMVTDTGTTVRTGELPWRDNQQGLSCIPAGTYTVTWGDSPAHGPCYHVQNVPGRTDIEIHAANLMGDTTKGFRCELLGCIAPGLHVGDFGGQRAVVASRPGLQRLILDLNTEDFQLTIVESYPQE